MIAASEVGTNSAHEVAFRERFLLTAQLATNLSLSNPRRPFLRCGTESLAKYATINATFGAFIRLSRGVRVLREEDT
jgi:hypothetical protein